MFLMNKQSLCKPLSIIYLILYSEDILSLIIMHDNLLMAYAWVILCWYCIIGKYTVEENHNMDTQVIIYLVNRCANSGVYWYPSHQKIFSITENFC